MVRYRLPLLLGLAHGVSDGAAGWILGSLAHQLSLTQMGLLVLLYNLLAFGAQPAAGLLADRWQRPRLSAAAGLLCNLSALLLLSFQPHSAVLLAGLGSALFHVGGGGLALCVTPHRAAGPGIFAAPGVLGLALGGTLAVAGTPLGWALAATLLLLALLVLRHPLPVLPYQTATQEDQQVLESHDWVMMVLLAAIALRSTVWTTFQYVLDGQTDILLGLALAAAGGKVAGGFLADRFGWRPWALGALLGSALLLPLGDRTPSALYLGVALLQSATPGMVAALAQSLPRAPATAAGLAFGLAILIGGFPAVLGAAPFLAAPPGVVALTLGALCLVWLVGRRRRSPYAGQAA